MTTSRSGLLFGLLAYMIAMRWLPYLLQNCDVKLDPSITCYPWSFSPLTAVCLLSGTVARDLRWGLALPLLALFISDVGIGVLTGHWDWAFPPESWWLTYACYTGAVLLGTVLRRRGGKSRLASAVGMGLLFEVGFFIVSNFAVWCLSVAYPNHPDYVHYSFTLRGLLNCFVLALPFFRWSPISTAFFTLMVFGPLGVSATNEKLAHANDLVPAPAR